MTCICHAQLPTYTCKVGTMISISGNALSCHKTYHQGQGKRWNKKCSINKRIHKVYHIMHTWLHLIYGYIWKYVCCNFEKKCNSYKDPFCTKVFVKLLKKRYTTKYSKTFACHNNKFDPKFAWYLCNITGTLKKDKEYCTGPQYKYQITLYKKEHCEVNVIVSKLWSQHYICTILSLLFIAYSIQRQSAGGL